jgi:uncharacterized protein (DUF58 family)
LELTSGGRLVLWFGVCLLAVGTLLSNALILLSAALSFLYLLIEAVLFHRAVDLAKEKIKLGSRPSTIETAVGLPFKLETIVTNASHSKFSIAQLSHSLPPQIDEEPHTPLMLILQSHGKQQTETVLRTKIPGRFEITTSTTLLERRSHLFSQAVAFPNKVIIMARPLVSRSVDPIETSVLQDLVVDHQRRGVGTDLAGIRPHNVHDDFHRIDWKATARAGKFMTKEAYLERDPALILMVDVSLSVNTRRHGYSTMETFLNEAGNFLEAIRIATPMGLILYDRREVVANIEARQGVGNRKMILRTLLERSKTTSVPASPDRRIIRPYADLARITNSLTKESGFAAQTQWYQKRLSTFASFILPFYEKAKSKYFERVTGEGAFKAFEIVCEFAQPALVIVISNDEANLDGLSEGAKKARISNHQVIVAILAVRELTRLIEIPSDLEVYGVRVLRCSPKELSRAINAEILALSHSRTIPLEATR